MEFHDILYTSSSLREKSMTKERENKDSIQLSNERKYNIYLLAKNFFFSFFLVYVLFVYMIGGLIIIFSNKMSC